MAERGPRGFWAYTETRWRWTNGCNMTFRAEITMPELVKRDRLSVRDLCIWDAMIVALFAHEMEHVEIGRAWASDIKRADCDGVAIKRINAEYDTADKELDARTKHGATTGVTLRP